MIKFFEHLTNNDIINETWKPIKEYQNYMISSCGRVKSMNYRKTGKEQALLPALNHDGYLFVVLSDNGNCKTITVHRLVALHFIENPKLKPQVNHKNGTKIDNRVINLELVTNKENSDHAWYNGLKENVREAGRKTAGENNGSCKLTDYECDKIRKRYSNGNITQRQLAEEFKCHQAHISRIINDKRRSIITPKR